MKLSSSCLRLLAAGMFLCGLSARAQDTQKPWSMTVYLQQSWPKQTETNNQIKQINAAFGSSFKTWDDVANLNLGVQVFRDLDPRWKVGIELDYSQGKISGTHPVEVAVDPGPPVVTMPATLSFEQKYTMYMDILAVVQYRPLGAKGRWVPFLQAGLGMAYEKDQTLLTVSNDLFSETLVQVNNDGWFPMLTAGVGVDYYFSEARTWYGELGVSYSWARLKHEVPASGSMVPPTVTADTDSTGPNLWLGIGWRF
jgi:hypothetical protein